MFTITLRLNEQFRNITNLGLSYQRLVVEIVRLQGPLVHVLVLEQVEALQAANLQQNERTSTLGNNLI